MSIDPSASNNFNQQEPSSFHTGEAQDALSLSNLVRSSAGQALNSGEYDYLELDQVQTQIAAESRTTIGDVGENIIVGSSQSQKIDGEAGNDLLFGEAGSDRIRGGEGNDLLLGNAGDDKLYGGEGNDLLLGNAGGDKLYGGEGQDILDGGEGLNILYGGEGQDIFVLSSASDRNKIVDFEAGVDLLTATDGTTIELTSHSAQSSRTRVTDSSGKILAILGGVNASEIGEDSIITLPMAVTPEFSPAAPETGSEAPMDGDEMGEPLDESPGSSPTDLPAELSDMADEMPANETPNEANDLPSDDMSGEPTEGSDPSADEMGAADDEMPAEETPTTDDAGDEALDDSSDPVDETSDEMPDEMSDDSEPVDDTPVEETLVNEAPTTDDAGDEALDDSSDPVDETSDEMPDEMGDDSEPVDDTPVEETLVNEAPSTDDAGDEALDDSSDPADETSDEMPDEMSDDSEPVDDTPVEETPVNEAPTTDDAGDEALDDSSDPVDETSDEMPDEMSDDSEPMDEPNGNTTNGASPAIIETVDEIRAISDDIDALADYVRGESFVPQGTGDTFYVSPNGSDDNPGTKEQPWKTIGYATSEASAVGAGDTILVGEGTYTEKVELEKSGSEALGHIHLKADGDVTIKEPTPDKFERWNEGVIDSVGQDYWVIDGFRVEDGSWAGISLRDASNMVVQNNHTVRSGASGIIILPDDGTPRTGDENITNSDITVINNIVEEANDNFLSRGFERSGGQESLTLWGVDGFTIAHNVVIGGNKEGIDVKVGTRNGVIDNNIVTKGAQVSGGRSGYTGGPAIYVDGYQADAFNIDITNNIVFGNRADGITIGDEEPDYGDVRDVRVSGNLVFDNGEQGVNGGAGVTVRANVNDYQIYDNAFYNNVQGLQIDGSDFQGGNKPDNGLVYQNVVAENTFRPGLIEDATNVTLADNVFTADYTTLFTGKGGEGVENLVDLNNQQVSPEEFESVAAAGGAGEILTWSSAQDSGDSVEGVDFEAFEAIASSREAFVDAPGAYQPRWVREQGLV